MEPLRPAMGAATPRLVLSDITKRFPGCLANDAVDLEVMPGEIHALLGENGAGKSTLVKIIYGVLAADGGDIAWEGQGHDQGPERREKARHRHGVSTLLAVRGADRLGEHRAWHASRARPRRPGDTGGRGRRTPTAYRSIWIAMSTIFRWASASASRFCAASYRTRSS